MFASFVADQGALDILVANAGLQRDASIAKMTLEQWNKVISVNLTGEFLCARAAIAQFRAQGDRRRLALARQDHLHELGASDDPVGRSRQLRELEGRHHADDAEPRAGMRARQASASIRSRRARSARRSTTTPGTTQKAYDSLMTLIPYGRIGEPEDIGKVAAWLALGLLRLHRRRDDLRRRRHDAVSRLRNQWLSAWTATTSSSSAPGRAARRRLGGSPKPASAYLLLERGGYLPRERENWDTTEVFGRARYQAGRNLEVGGRQQLQTGAALLGRRQLQGLRRCAVPAARDRFPRRAARRRRDAGMAAQIRRVRALLSAGRRALSRAWRARRGPDGAVGERPLPEAAIRHEPRIAELAEGLAREGLHPFHLPIGAWIEEDARAAHAAGFAVPALRSLRRLSEPDQRQGRRADRLRRSGAEGASEPDVADRRLCRAAD